MLTRCLKKTMPFVALFLFSATDWAQQGSRWRLNPDLDPGICQALSPLLPRQTLDTTETAQLTYMREEVKLARDTYLKLYSKWPLPIFRNASQAGQRHLNAIGGLLDRYGLYDPAANSGTGVFRDPGLQALYGDLVNQGGASVGAALRVGAAINDLNLHNLRKALAATDNDDLKIVYQNLQKASQNHLQAFVGRLCDLGESYSAQYISAPMLAEILSSTSAAGRGSRGNAIRSGGAGRGNRDMCPWRATR